MIPKKSISFERSIVKNVIGKEYTFYACNPTIVEFEDGYLVNIRWVNYSYHEDGRCNLQHIIYVNLNSRYKIDKNFIQTSEEEFLQEDYQKIPICGSFGLEDFRIFKVDQDYYYTATGHDTTRNILAVSSGIYDMDTYKVPIQIIVPSFYDAYKSPLQEKNWAYCMYQNKMAFVYEWYPLKITEIDYETNQLNLILTKPMPSFFENARGSSSGYTIGNEIWFVVHNRRRWVKNGELYSYYEDSFVVFDLNMNLKRYSEWFKLGNKRIQFCTGIVVRDKEIILSYSLLDRYCYISVYDASSLGRLKWYSS